MNIGKTGPQCIYSNLKTEAVYSTNKLVTIPQTTRRRFVDALNNYMIRNLRTNQCMVVAEKISKAPARLLQLQGMTLFGAVPTQTVCVIYCGDTTGLLFSHSSLRCIRVTFSAKIIFQSASHRSSKQGLFFLKPRRLLSERKKKRSCT